MKQINKTDEEWDIALGISTPASTHTIPEQPQILENSFHASQVIPMMQADMNFLAAVILPEIFTFMFPPVFLAVWAWIKEYLHKEGRHFPQLALGLPRGFGKTTVMKLLIIYVVLFTNRRFILVVSETERKAINIVSDVMNMLASINILRLFGDWKLGAETDQQALKKFGFRGRNIIILAMGVGGSLRGQNLDNARPDFMLFDDIQSREAADSDTESANIESWFFNTALKSKDPMGCVYLFVANMYPTPNSLLRKLKRNPTWIKFIAGGILSDGTSLWEELQPLEQLLDEFERDLAAGKPEAFYSEVMNDEEVNLNTKIDLSKVTVKEDTHGEFIAGSFIVIDPATDKKNADYVSVGCFDLIEGIPWLSELEEGNMSPGDTIRCALRMAISKGVSLILVEGTAYQYSLLYWFNQITQQLGIAGITCLDIYPRGGSKNTRIVNMFKQLVAAEIILTEKVRALCFQQISQFNPVKTDNTDGILDLLTYAPRVLSEFGDYITINNPLSEQILEESSSLLYSEQDNSPI